MTFETFEWFILFVIIFILIISVISIYKIIFKFDEKHKNDNYINHDPFMFEEMEQDTKNNNYFQRTSNDISNLQYNLKKIAKDIERMKRDNK